MKRLHQVAPAFWAIVDHGLFSAAGLLVNVLLARLLGSEEYGAYAISFAVQLGFQQLQSAFFTEPMLVLMAQRYDDRPQAYLRALLVAHAVTWTVAGILVVSIANLPFVAPSLRAPLVAMAIATPFINLLQMMRRVCYARMAPGYAAAGALLHACLTPTAIWWLGRVGRLSIPGAYAVLACSASLTSLWWIGTWSRGAARREGALRWPEAIAAHWSFARFGVPAALLGWVPLNGWYVVLPYFAAGAGSWAISGQLRALVNLMQPMIQINGALGTLLTPTFSRATQSNPAYSPWRWALGIGLVSALYCPLLAVFGPWLMRLFYAGAYDADRTTLAVIGLVPACYGLLAALRAYCVATERPALPFESSALGALACLPVLPLCSRDPLLGACAGMAVGYAVQAGWLTRRVRHPRRA